MAKFIEDFCRREEILKTAWTKACLCLRVCVRAHLLWQSFIKNQRQKSRIWGRNNETAVNIVFVTKACEYKQQLPQKYKLGVNPVDPLNVYQFNAIVSGRLFRSRMQFWWALGPFSLHKGKEQACEWLDTHIHIFICTCKLSSHSASIKACSRPQLEELPSPKPTSEEATEFPQPDSLSHMTSFALESWPLLWGKLPAWYYQFI